MTPPQLQPCRECGGALQRIATVPGHVVCGSGHLWLESEVVLPDDADPATIRRSPAQLQRVGGDRRPPHPGK
jgi:hypothetical protein